MPAVTVHTCPRCELRFEQLFELRIHLDQDHPRPQAEENPVDAPALRPPRSVVVALDPAHPRSTLVHHGSLLARALGLGVELVTVAPVGLLDEARAHVRAKAALVRTDGAAVAFAVEQGADVAAVLCDRLERVPADLVVVAPRSRHDLGHAFGSTAAALCSSSPVPVVLVGHHVDPAPQPVGRVVACIDASDDAGRILTVADRLRRRLGADLHLVEAMTDAVALPPDLYETNALRRLAASLGSPPTTYDVLHGTSVSAAIERYVGSDPGALVVLGSHGRTGLSRLVHGSVVARVVDHLRCPAVVVPRTVVLGRSLEPAPCPSTLAGPTSGP